MTASAALLAERIAGQLVDVPGFPRPGVVFKDITPVLADPVTFAAIVEAIAAGTPDVQVVAGIEARGFMLAAPVALALGAAFVPLRKAGKLPRPVLEESYALEYGQATLTMHVDAIQAGQRVLLVDDVLATGGTAGAASSLVRRGGGHLAALAVVIELAAFGGRGRLAGVPVDAVLTI